MVRLPTEPGSDVLTNIGLYNYVESREEEEERNRVFYVACTRAADRLILSASLESLETPKGPWLKKLASLFDLGSGRLLDASPDSPALATVTAAETKTIETTLQNDRVDIDKLLDDLTVETAPPQAGVGPWTPDAADLRNFSVSKLTGQLRFSAPRDLADVTPAGASDVPPETKGEPNSYNPAQFGTLVHAVLEKLSLDRADSLRESVHDWCEALTPIHVKRDQDVAQEEAEETILSFLGSPRWEAMRTSPRLEREIEFLMRVEDELGVPALVKGFIDAAYLDEDGRWVVVDYKTDRADSGRQVTELAAAYRFQLRAYALAIETALGVSPDAMMLCFLRNGEERRYEWNAEERRLAQQEIAERISEARQAATAALPLAGGPRR